MLELPHVIVGATIATLITNPLISLPLSLASHFLGDHVPHWNPHIGQERKKFGHIQSRSFVIIVIDCIAALIVGILLSARFLPDQRRFWISMFCCFLAVAPDVVEAPHFFLGVRNQWISKLLAFQKAHQWDVPLPWGIVSQIIVILLSLIVIYSHS